MACGTIMPPALHNTPDFTPVRRLMEQGVSKGVFPGAVLLAASEGGIRFHDAFGVTDHSSGQPVTLDTLFDLASLTKSLATGVALMKLFMENKISPGDKLSHHLNQYHDSDKKDISILSLLNHTAGLPACKPYYKTLLDTPPSQRRKKQEELLLNEKLINKPGARVHYSDIGFMILKQLIEEITGKAFSQYVSKGIYTPLGITDLYFMDMPPAVTGGKIFAATEICPVRKTLVKGVVHDLNAYALGGVDGHAGLFGDARGVYDLVKIIYEDYKGSGRFFTENCCRFFLKKHPEGRNPNMERALGFDVPSFENSSSGRFFSRESVGHLGFTGVSFWLDLKKGAIVILLTNRVHPTAENIKIRKFRPIIHDAVMKELIREK